jgi:hypothetical protein
VRRHRNDDEIIPALQTINIRAFHSVTADILPEMSFSFVKDIKSDLGGKVLSYARPDKMIDITS